VWKDHIKTLESHITTDPLDCDWCISRTNRKIEAENEMDLDRSSLQEWTDAKVMGCQNKCKKDDSLTRCNNTCILKFMGRLAVDPDKRPLDAEIEMCKKDADCNYRVTWEGYANVVVEFEAGYARTAVDAWYACGSRGLCSCDTMSVLMDSAIIDCQRMGLLYPPQLNDTLEWKGRSFEMVSVKMDGNRFLDVPDGLYDRVEKLSGRKWSLTLANNQLVCVPNISNPNLASLDLADNQITVLGVMSSKLRFDEFNLDNNPIKAVSPEQLNRLAPPILDRDGWTTSYPNASTCVHDKSRSEWRCSCAPGYTGGSGEHGPPNGCVRTEYLQQCQRELDVHAETTGKTLIVECKRFTFQYPNVYCVSNSAADPLWLHF
jgi:hypothetical protein